MHNPLRSEAEAFKFLIVVGSGCAAVIALVLITEPLYGAILLGLLVGIGIGITIQASQGSERQPVTVAEHPSYRIVVLANETVGGGELAAEINARARGKNADVLVVTPALTQSRAQHWASDTDEARQEAEARMQSSVAALRRGGIRVVGQIGDSDPNEALADALREFGADEVIISTHPPDRSRWLEHGVVSRARQDLTVPVTHVVVDLEAHQT